MLCLPWCLVPLIFVCSCQFISACQSSVSDTEAKASQQQTLSADPVEAGTQLRSSGAEASQQQTLSADPVPSQETAEEKKMQETKTPAAVWCGNVQGEDPLVSAADIYSESPSKPAGIYEYQGLVFCIVEIPFDEDHEEKRYYQRQGLVLEKEMLRKHYQLPAEFQLQCRILENRIDDDFVNYRYATVYRLKDIQALQNKAGAFKTTDTIDHAKAMHDGFFKGDHYKINRHETTAFLMEDDVDLKRDSISSGIDDPLPFVQR